MSRQVLFIFIIISTFTIACGSTDESSSAGSDYHTIAGEYSMEKDGFTYSCTNGGDAPIAAVPGVPVSITQDENKFTVKYLVANPETDSDISNWTQDCTIESESNFTCTEGYDFQVLAHYVLTVEGSFTTDGMVGVVNLNFSRDGSPTTCSGEYGISITTG